MITIEAQRLEEELGTYPYRVLFSVSAPTSNTIPTTNTINLQRYFRGRMIQWGNDSCNGLFVVEHHTVRFTDLDDALLAKLKFT